MNRKHLLTAVFTGALACSSLALLAQDVPPNPPPKCPAPEAGDCPMGTCDMPGMGDMKGISPKMPMSPENRQKIQEIMRDEMAKQNEAKAKIQANRMEMKKLTEAYKADPSEANKAKITEKVSAQYDQRIAELEKRLNEMKQNKAKVVEERTNQVIAGKAQGPKMDGARGERKGPKMDGARGERKGPKMDGARGERKGQKKAGPDAGLQAPPPTAPEK